MIAARGIFGGMGEAGLAKGKAVEGTGLKEVVLRVKVQRKTLKRVIWGVSPPKRSIYVCIYVRYLEMGVLGYECDKARRQSTAYCDFDSEFPPTYKAWRLTGLTPKGAVGRLALRHRTGNA